MIKRTLYFGSPSYLSLQNGQLVLHLPEVEKNGTLPESYKKEVTASIPVEDIGTNSHKKYETSVFIVPKKNGKEKTYKNKTIISNRTIH